MFSFGSACHNPEMIQPKQKSKDRQRSLHFEPLEQRFLLAADFGDAPSPYPTQLLENGARHEAVGPVLGTVRDTEPNGIASSAADGDGTDEDGIQLGVIRSGQLSATAIVTVSNVVGTAKIDAWIDFNRDGNWGGSQEAIASGVILTNGTHAIEFDVPESAVPGTTYARFRVSSLGQLAPSGQASDGEVEDYAVIIQSPELSSGELGSFLPVSSTDINVHELDVADLDSDGDLDVLVHSSDTVKMHWYENRNENGFHEHVLSPEFERLDHMEMVDIDLDGDVDVVTTGRLGNDRSLSIYWNDGTEVFTRQVIATSVIFTNSFDVADIDGDGDLDILAGSQEDESLSWYENQRNGSFGSHFVRDVGDILVLEIADVDSDGDLDFLVAHSLDRYDNVLALLDNDGSNNYTYSEIFDSNDYIRTVVAAEIDLNSPLEILTGSSLWQRTEEGDYDGYGLNFNIAPGSILSVADFDADGDLDVLPTSLYRDSVYWFENNGTGLFEFNFNNFASHVAQSVADAALVVPGDIDGDGDIDVVVAGEGGVYWHPNVSSDGSVTSSETKVAESSDSIVDIEFVREGDISGSLAVEFQISGSAAYLEDYTVEGSTSFDGSIGSISFSAGEGSAALMLSPVTDSVFEGNEIFELTLTEGSDYVVRGSSNVIVQMFDPADFGDAPAPYHSSFTKLGAQHNAVGPMLGDSRDIDTDGQPNNEATGDDLSNVNDENGVSFQPLYIGKANATAEVTVSNVEAGAKLDAWIDFDQDGTWSGAQEHIAASLPVLNGVTTIDFAVPSDSVSGTTFARFRLSTVGSLGPGGLAMDGEVEDYAIEINPAAPGTGVYSSPKLLDTRATHANLRDHSVADFDHDGDLDVITATSSEMIWYRNIGAGDYREHVLSEVPPYISELNVADLDGDGDTDIAISESGSIAWYENHENQTLTKHSLIDLAAITRLGDAYSGLAIRIADLDSDGDLDLVSGVENTFGFGAMNGRVYWHENDGAGMFTTHYIDGFGVARNEYLFDMELDVVDLDQDGDSDIVVTAATEIIWYENSDQQFEERQIAYRQSGTHTDAISADFDQDGDVDIISIEFFGRTLAFHENRGQESFSRSVIVTGDFGFSALSTADIDADGDLDIVVSVSGNSSIESNSRLFVNLGSGNFSDSSIVNCDLGNVHLVPADLDGDGDIDLLAADNLWLENINTLPSADFDADEDVDGADFLTWQRGFGAATTDASYSNGDSNNDGSIDATDLANWLSTFETNTSTFNQADFDNNQQIDGADFLSWQRGFSTLYDAIDLLNWLDNYGNTTSPQFAAIREDQSVTTREVKSHAELFDAAIALEISECELADEKPLILDESYAVEHAFADQTLIDSRFAPISIAEVDNLSAANVNELDSGERPRFEAELLERVFG